MKLTLSFKSFVKAFPLRKPALIRILTLVAMVLDIPTPLGVGVVIVGDRRMRALNQRYRRKNGVTDVLAFPLHGRSFKKIRKEYAYPHAIFRDSRKNMLEWGDIVIDLPEAKRRAKKAGKEIGAYLTFLIVHASLHLGGLDHEKSIREKKRMNFLQETILQKLDKSLDKS